jgi:hypothetical protein
MTSQQHRLFIMSGRGVGRIRWIAYYANGHLCDNYPWFSIYGLDKFKAASGQIFNFLSNSYSYDRDMSKCEIFPSFLGLFSPTSHIICLTPNSEYCAMAQSGQLMQFLDTYDPTTQSSDELRQTVHALKQQLLNAEAVQTLLPAKDEVYRRKNITRVRILLDYVFGSAEATPKLSALRGLEPSALIICGLCLTQRAVETMKKELFDAIIKHAISLALQLGTRIQNNSDIHTAVLQSKGGSNDEFLESMSPTSPRKLQYTHYQDIWHRASPKTIGMLLFST